MAEILFYLIFIGIIFPFTFYPISLFIIGLFYKKEEITPLLEDELPNVNLIITAYNEEKSIVEKLENVLNLEYPSDKLKIIVASDGSTDNTHSLVNSFIEDNPLSKFMIELFVVEGRMGKTHVQNETVKIVESDIVAFSDTNSLWNSKSLVKIINIFQDENIGYVAGQLSYSNSDISISSQSENSYWNFDLWIRKLESKISSIVGGNGAIYAIRRKDYEFLPPLLSHDGFIPAKMVIKGKKAKYCEEAVAYEKAGENTTDEFKRKVRMQRGQPWKKYYDIQKFNPFETGWFSYFYFGHKYLKYLLYVYHPLLLILNFALIGGSFFYGTLFIFHIGFYLLALICWISGSKSKIFYYPYYYSMTIIAQGVSVINTFRNKTKSTWDKAESTR